MSNLQLINPAKNQIVGLKPMKKRSQFRNSLNSNLRGYNASSQNYGSYPKQHSKSHASFVDNCFMLSLKDEEFINAKYRLIVRDSCQTSAHQHEPNKLLPWDEVQAVVSTQSGLSECPICLYPPVAPRMEKCGHIYCYPCLLQYIANGDTCGFRKCAICDHNIELSHLKRVALNPLTPPSVGDYADLTLIQKPKNGYKLYPLVETTSDERICFKKNTFERLLSVPDMDLIVLINEELDSLLSQLAVSKVDDLCFEIVPFLESCIKGIRTEQSETYSRIKQAKNVPDLPRNNSSDDVQEKFQFYQAVDGQDIYLSGLNWRCLNAQFGEKLPSKLTAPILEIKRQVLTPSSRKMLRYLSHLPDGREVLIVELDLSEILSEEILCKFASEIISHADQREIMKERDKELTRLKIEQENRFIKSAEGFKLLGKADLSERVPTAEDFMPLTPETQNAQKTPSAQQSPLPLSFAAMTRAGASAIVDKNRRVVLTREMPVLPPPMRGSGAAEHWPSLSACSVSIPIPSPEDTAGSNSKRKKHRKKNASNGSDSGPCPSPGVSPST